LEEGRRREFQGRKIRKLFSDSPYFGLATLMRLDIKKKEKKPKKNWLNPLKKSLNPLVTLSSFVSFISSIYSLFVFFFFFISVRLLSLIFDFHAHRCQG